MDTLRYGKIIDYSVDLINKYYDNGDFASPNVRKKIHRQLLPHLYKYQHPGINGYYFIFMQSGTWLDDALQYLGNEELYFPKAPASSIHESMNFFGLMAKDITFTDPILDYDQVTGKAKNILEISKETYSGDFSIEILDNYKLDYLIYNNLWYTYIKRLKEGYIPPPAGMQLKTDYYYEVPYHNAVWVLYMNSKMQIKTIIKLLGVTPVSNPIKTYLGKRGNTELTSINYNFKSIDYRAQVYYSESDVASSSFFHEFVDSFPI